MFFLNGLNRSIGSYRRFPDLVEELLRVSNPALSRLRLVAIAAEKEKRLGEALLATEIRDICHGCGLELPGERLLNAFLAATKTLFEGTCAANYPQPIYRAI